MKKSFKLLSAIALLLILALSLSSCDILLSLLEGDDGPAYVENLEDVPEFSGDAYVIINENKPFFTEEEIVSESFEEYEALDRLGRCGVTVACVGIDIMPEDDRGDIDSVTPSGWPNSNPKYDCVKGKYLYHRCHLIGHQLTGENDNDRNLITGTQFLNINGMLPFENQIAAYVKESENHVMYRVTPIFKGNNLVASGVLMEAWSVEDNGDGICFCIYAYNNQPGVSIDYSNGASKLDDGVPFPDDDDDVEIPEDGSPTYILNTNSKKFHKPSCTYADNNHREEFFGTREEIIDEGYDPCGVCKP